MRGTTRMSASAAVLPAVPLRRLRVSRRALTTLVLAGLVLVSFGPSRIVAQFVPFACWPLAFVLAPGRIAQPARETLLVALLAVMTVVSAVVNATELPNLLLGVVTWFGPFLVFSLAYAVGDQASLRPLLRMLLVVSLVQIPIGVLQMFAFIGFRLANPFQVYGLAAGDWFSGTLMLSGKNSHVVSLKLALSMLLAWQVSRHVTRLGRTGRLVVLALLIFGWLTPSAVHSMLCFLAAIGTASLLLASSVRTVAGLLGISLLAVAIVAVTQWENVLYARNLILLTAGSTGVLPGKAAALVNTLTELPAAAPQLPWTGVGLGRYSSYAAMILSGEHLSSANPLIPVSFSDYTSRFILPYWNRELLLANEWASGVVNQPFFTYMSIYGELGLPGLACFTGFWLVVTLRLRRVVRRARGTLEGALATALLLFTLLLVYLFLFDNWYEDARLMIPYMILTGVLLRQARALPPDTRTGPAGG